MQKELRLADLNPVAARLARQLRTRELGDNDHWKLERAHRDFLSDWWTEGPYRIRCIPTYSRSGVRFMKDLCAEVWQNCVYGTGGRHPYPLGGEGMTLPQMILCLKDPNWKLCETAKTYQEVPPPAPPIGPIPGTKAYDVAVTLGTQYAPYHFSVDHDLRLTPDPGFVDSQSEEPRKVQVKPRPDEVAFRMAELATKEVRRKMTNFIMYGSYEGPGGEPVMGRVSVRGLKSEQVLIQPEPPPSGGQGDVWEDVCSHSAIVNKDDPLIPLYKARRMQGIEKYGTPLRYWNGRDPKVDALQECLDGIVYCEQGYREACRRGGDRGELEADAFAEAQHHLKTAARLLLKVSP